MTFFMAVLTGDYDNLKNNHIYAFVALYAVCVLFVCRLLLVVLFVLVFHRMCVVVFLLRKLGTKRNNLVCFACFSLLRNRKHTNKHHTQQHSAKWIVSLEVSVIRSWYFSCERKSGREYVYFLFGLCCSCLFLTLGLCLLCFDACLTLLCSYWCVWLCWSQKHDGIAKCSRYSHRCAVRLLVFLCLITTTNTVTNAIGMLCTWFIPETRGRSLEELSQDNSLIVDVDPRKVSPIDIGTDSHESHAPIVSVTHTDSTSSSFAWSWTRTRTLTLNSRVMMYVFESILQ